MVYTTCKGVDKMSIKVSFERVMLVKERVGSYELPREIRCPEEAYNAIRVTTNVQAEAQEVFGILILNIKNRIVAVHEISRGTLNSSMAHPREVFKPAVLHNAASIICFHNHPSGDKTPSEMDINITNRLVEVGDIMGIEILDHIIVTDNGYASLKELGVM